MGLDPVFSCEGDFYLMKLSHSMVNSGFVS